MESMNFLHWFQDNFLHLDQSLAHLTLLYGAWIYGILFLLVFSETGLVVAPFLPGDSLLFAVGAFAAAKPSGGINYFCAFFLLTLAATLGNMLNFQCGKWIGSSIFKEKALVLKKEYLHRASLFFSKHGPKALILARFLPIFRTLVPFVSGMAAMEWNYFLLYSIVGSFSWVFLMMTAGLLFGRITWVQHHFEAVVLGIICISMLPLLYEVVANHCSKFLKR